MFNLIINNKSVSVPDGLTLLEAAKQNNIYIPHLCYLEGVHKFGSCRLCVVEVEGTKELQASCMVPVKEGMVVHTNTPKVRKVRKNIYELLLSNHPKDCLSCETNANCELQDMGVRLGVTKVRFAGKTSEGIIDSSPSIFRDTAKCILCRRCVTVCNATQDIGILNAQNRGFKTLVGPAMDLALSQVNCTYCGQCTVVCPVGAIKETDEIENVWDAIGDKSKTVVVQLDPAVSAAIGEEFGFPAGTNLSGELVSCLREMGFDNVFDTNFAMDLTIVEQGAELLTRLKNFQAGEEAKLPMLTSCSPGWIKYAEHNYPEKLEYLSTCKSPHTMLGALAKSFYAEKTNVDPKELYVVSIMPCTAKKFEISRPEMKNDGLPNVDAVLTTRELARMIKEAGMDLQTLKKVVFDQPLALSSGGAQPFGAGGGVMEATLLTIHLMVTGRELPNDKLDLTNTGLDQIKEVQMRIENPVEAYGYLEGVTVRAASISGLRGAKFLMDQIVNGESPYDYIEVMGCPGGCVNGGGQPRSSTPEILGKRLEALEQGDGAKLTRKPYDNKLVMKLYEVFFQEPNSQKALDLLHTHYTKRGKLLEELG